MAKIGGLAPNITIIDRQTNATITDRTVYSQQKKLFDVEVEN